MGRPMRKSPVSVTTPAVPVFKSANRGSGLHVRHRKIVHVVMAIRRTSKFAMCVGSGREVVKEMGNGALGPSAMTVSTDLTGVSRVTKASKNAEIVVDKNDDARRRVPGVHGSHVRMRRSVYPVPKSLSLVWPNAQGSIGYVR